MSKRINKISIQRPAINLEDQLHDQVEQNLFESVKLIRQAKSSTSKESNLKLINELSCKIEELLKLEEVLKNKIQDYVVKTHDLDKQSYMEKRNQEITEMKKQIRRNIGSIHKIEEGVIHKSDRSLFEKLMLGLLVFPGIPCTVGVTWLMKLSLLQSLWIFVPMAMAMVVLLSRIFRDDRKIEKKKRISKALDLTDKHLKEAINERKFKRDKEVAIKDAKFKKGLKQWLDKEIKTLEKKV
ncbi:MAG TPA: hypothetical protein QF353_00820 [Gammaproteobacteria bacterium]|nr:hypothetical protein [Gammaproteobacteria bacterium]